MGTSNKKYGFRRLVNMASKPIEDPVYAPGRGHNLQYVVSLGDDVGADVTVWHEGDLIEWFAIMSQEREL